MIQKWYRGHSRQRSALDNFGVIWLTDDPEYAQVYAETEDDTISVVYVDGDKVKPADWWYDPDFEPYFPDDENIAEFKNEGYNGYYFMATYDYDEYQCLALFSKEPIVKVEEYKENNINENMKLNFNDIRYVIQESTKRILSEVFNSNRVKEDFTIEMYDIKIEPSYLEDELDMYSGPNGVHVVCTFDYDRGQKGDYDTEPISPSYELIDVIPGINQGLDSNLSPELFSAVLKGACNYVWEHQTEFEESMLENDKYADDGPNPDDEYEKYRENRF